MQHILKQFEDAGFCRRIFWTLFWAETPQRESTRFVGSAQKSPPICLACSRIFKLFEYILYFICWVFFLSACFTSPSNGETESKTTTSMSTKNNYQRDPTHTYLSSPEWQNVLAADEYAKFIHHTPFYEFPYMQSIASYWNVFGKSWNAARQQHSFVDVLSSDYTFMNLFVGVFMTIEYSFKSLISLPIRLLVQGDEPRSIQLIVEGDERIIQILHPQVKILENIQDTNFKRIEVPRYDELKNILQLLPTYQEIIIHEIAGNKKIQLTLETPEDFSIEAFNPLEIVKLYEWTFPTRRDHKFIVILAETKCLASIIAFIKAHNITIEVVHDF